ncbi:MAG: hypothetical protein AB7Q27_20685, partial [Acidimicrobiia bacterium]
MGRERTEPPGVGLELVAIGAGGVVVGSALVTAGGARMSGAEISGGLAEWLRVAGRLASGRPPVEAWGEWASGVPAAGWYWVCTGVVAATAAVVAVGLAVLWRRLASAGRSRFGQSLDARIAGRADVVPLRVDDLS